MTIPDGLQAAVEGARLSSNCQLARDQMMYAARAPLISVALGLPMFATLAQAQSLQEKLCIFSAAENLPNIPGLSIRASRTKSGVTATEAANILVDGFATRLRELNRHFDFVSWQLLEAMEKTYPERDLLARNLVDKITGILLVEIDVRAATQDATFTFVCAWGDLGRTITASTGMSR